MIAKLTGRLDSSGAGHAVIDVGGVGYLVETLKRRCFPELWSLRTRL